MGEKPKYEFLIYARQGPVTTLTMNRPESLNALNKKLSAELNEAVRQVRADRECRVMVLRGAGNNFSPGDDIKEFNEWNWDACDPVNRDGYWQGRQYQETSCLIEDMTAVTIAAVDGVCMGGGLELTLVCDFVIATDRSRWGMPEIDWDITPGWGGISRIFRYAGRRKAKEWNMIGNEFKAQEAKDYNLVSRLCSADKLDDEVKALVEVILAKNPLTMRRTKFTLTKAFEMATQSALSLEVGMIPTDPKREGMAIFKTAEGRKKRRALAKNFWQDCCPKN